MNASKYRNMTSSALTLPPPRPDASQATRTQFRGKFDALKMILDIYAHPRLLCVSLTVVIAEKFTQPTGNPNGTPDPTLGGGID